MKTKILLMTVLLSLFAHFSYGDDRINKWNEDIDYLVSRLEISHVNLYANIPKEVFAKHADELKQKISISTDIEMRLGLMELIARIKNVHVYSTIPVYSSNYQQLKESYQYYPIKIYQYKDGVFISATNGKYQNILGEKLLKIGDLSVEAVIEKLAKFISADNHMSTMDFMTRGVFNDGQLLKHIGASDSPHKMTLTLQRADRKIEEVEIKTSPDVSRTLFGAYTSSNDTIFAMNGNSINPLPLHLQRASEYYWFKYIPEKDTVYLQINVIVNDEEESFGEFCKRLFQKIDTNNVKNLIIDLRHNVGGNHLELPLVKGILARPNLDKADHLSLITGRTTVSASQHLTSVLKWYTNARRFGESTGSKPNQYGAIGRFSLPNSDITIACGIDYYQDAQPYDFSMTTDPNFFISSTSDDFKNNHDPVLEAIFNFDSYSKLREDFVPTLAAAYGESGIASLIKTFVEIKPEYTKYGYSFEDLLYDDLDLWMYYNKNNKEEYIKFLEFCCEQLPTSLRFLNDLASFYSTNGDTEKAIATYQKCLEINPEHFYAKRKMGLILLEEAREK